MLAGETVDVYLHWNRTNGRTEVEQSQLNRVCIAIDTERNQSASQQSDSSAEHTTIHPICSGISEFLHSTEIAQCHFQNLQFAGSTGNHGKEL